MPDEVSNRGGPDGAWYSYAIIRVVPRVERGEFLNAGVILFARTAGFLEARVHLDEDRLRALSPHTPVPLVRSHLETFQAVAHGDPAGGPVASLDPSQRFHWLTAPRSTVIQTSPVHVGCGEHPAAELDELMREFVL